MKVRGFFVALLACCCCLVYAEAPSEIRALNVEVANHWKKSGAGIPLRNLNLNLDSLLSSEEGSCAQESYLFSRRVMEKGYSARRLGLWAHSGANDVMVEVELDGQWKLFVPSTGVYYEHSFGEIFDNPVLADNYLGEPLHGGEMFVNSGFFGDLNRIDVYENLNSNEFDLTESAEFKGRGLFPSPNNLEAINSTDPSAYVAGKKGRRQEITVAFNRPVDIYRAWIEWYSDKDFSKEVEIEIDQIGKKSIFKIDVTRYLKGTTSDLPLGAHESVNSITLRFLKFNGQNRLLIKSLRVF